MPKFDTFEEMEAWLEKNGENSTPTTNSSRPSKKSAPKSKKKPAKKDEGVRIIPAPDPSVWCSTHFYTQPGDTINKVRMDAKEEAKVRNENVRVFYHDHIFGEACVNLCGTVDQ